MRQNGVGVVLDAASTLCIIAKLYGKNHRSLLDEAVPTYSFVLEPYFVQIYSRPPPHHAELMKHAAACGTHVAAPGTHVAASGTHVAACTRYHPGHTRQHVPDIIQDTPGSMHPISSRTHHTGHTTKGIPWRTHHT